MFRPFTTARNASQGIFTQALPFPLARSSLGPGQTGRLETELSPSSTEQITFQTFLEETNPPARNPIETVTPSEESSSNSSSSSFSSSSSSDSDSDDSDQEALQSFPRFRWGNQSGRSDPRTYVNPFLRNRPIITENFPRRPRGVIQ